MRILIDTNIIIGLEYNKVIDGSFSEFYQYAVSNQCDIFFHQACLEDIANDRNLERRNIILSKSKKYSILPNPAEVTEEFVNMLGQKNKNDIIDNIQLFQIYKGYVELFVTEDTGVLKKAKKIRLESTILPIKKALEKLKKKFEFRIPRHPSLDHCSVREIRDRVDEPFFDSLRENYSEFNLWFEKCARQNRKCYKLTVNNKLAALLIYNIEKVEDHKIPDIYENALKMCTLKTSESAFGAKIGELFLNKMFQLCIEQNIKYLYLTLFDKYKFLIGLLTRFGFQQKEFINKNEKKEIIMIKNLEKDSIEKKHKPNTISIHPFYSDTPDFNKFVIPIQKQFYNSLFKDSAVRQRSLFDKIDTLSEIQGNSIIKAYICSARRKDMEKGDILFFYFSRDQKLIEALGVLDQISRVDDLEILKRRVRGKTVFSEKKLDEIFNSKPSKSLLVIIFRLIYYLKNPIELKTIKTLNCFANKFITITKMEEEDYLKLKKEDFFDECYLVNKT